MFWKTKSLNGERSGIIAFVGEGAAIKGLLTFQGTVRIDGRVEGEIVSEGNLIVGENAIIEATIHIGSISVSGTINGTIHARKNIILHPNARIYGNLITPSLIMEDGVLFQGVCQMEELLQHLPAPESPDRTFLTEGSSVE